MFLFGYREHSMSVSSILNLLHELNKTILCEPLASMLIYSTSAINSVMNLHEFNTKYSIYHTPKLRPFKVNYGVAKSAWLCDKKFYVNLYVQHHILLKKNMNFSKIIMVK
jgi:hypothetical protein